MNRTTRLTVACLLLALSANLAALQLIPLSMPEARNAAQPSITADSNGGFILTWQQKIEGAATLNFARLDADGAIKRQGEIARSADAHPWFINWADFPSLIVLDNGDWVTYWLQKRSQATYAYDIHLIRSTDRGGHWDDDLIVHRDGTASEHGFVSLVPAGDDRVLVVWLDGRNSGGAGGAHEHSEGAGAMTLRSAIVDRAGDISAEAEIDARTCDCCSTDAARIGNATMLLYRDRSETEIRDMYFSLRDRKGAWSDPKLVHADAWKIAGCPVNGPALAVNRGRALALWTTMDGDTLSVRAALGDQHGFGAMIELDHGTQTQGHVDAAPWGQQQFLVTWVGGEAMPTANTVDAPRTDVTSIRLNVLDQRLTVIEHAVLAVLPKGSNPGMPRIATSGKHALAVWTESVNGSPTIRGALIKP